MSVVMITGAATGIGNLTAHALADAGHVVYASMRDTDSRNAERAERLVAEGRDRGVDLRVVELDVLSQESAHAAVDAVLAEAGRLDVVVHNAGHMSLGYLEAFTVEELAQQFDVNAFSVQRVNRAALPHLRERGEGTLLYVGSTTTVSVPPLMGQENAEEAMPLEDFLDEVMELLESEPDAKEILVDRVRFLRFAEAEGRYDDVLDMLAGYQQP